MIFAKSTHVAVFVFKLFLTVKHVSMFLIEFCLCGMMETSRSETSCIFITTNLAHIGTGINVTHFKKLILTQVVLLERHFAASD